MPTLLIEEDHFLKIVPVILDPDIPSAHRDAVADFFAHDVPDFLGWCERLRARLPGLYPARIVWARDRADFLAKLPDADAAVVESLVVDRAALARAPRLRIVQKFGTIGTNIDAHACAERRITVAILHRHVNVAVAEQCFALMLALAKRISALDGLVERSTLEAAGYSVRERPPGYVGYSNFARVAGLKTLYGATLGIIGMGEVGREIARRAAPFGMTTLYHQRRALAPADEQALAARYVSLADLMAQSDYIVVQLPLTPSTRSIIGVDTLRSVKPGAFLINCARAELVDRAALVDALDSGRLGGLALDVGYDEPARPDDPLLKFRGRPNVILMPHTAIAARHNALSDLERLCINLWSALGQSGS
ncbi:MAG TPA: NAD(P)-dependent oxidoreductase [Xanthobacteraceae bacterium]|nr:NAD(P)-dependent oxidoreductase [Xanthobacteraceae bacterium]